MTFRTGSVLLTALAGGCWVDMPLGTLLGEDVDAGADADSDGDLDAGDPISCTEWWTSECRVPRDGDEFPVPPFESLDVPIGEDQVLQSSGAPKFTAIEADANGRLYAFFWWVSPGELDEPELGVEHLTWRTRAAGETEWSADVRAVPGLTREDVEQARCASPSDTPLQFASTDDGYLHVFWRKNNACVGGKVWFVEHAIFAEGEIAHREQMPLECTRSTDLRMTDAMALPGGEVLVAFLCGLRGYTQRYTCGCWSERASIGGEGVMDRQEDLELAQVDLRIWIVVRATDGTPWARPLDDLEGYVPIEVDGLALGDIDTFPDGDGGFWAGWHAGSVPSDGVRVRVARLSDGAFGAIETLPGGTTSVQDFDGDHVPGRGPILVTEEAYAIDGDPDVIVDEFFVRWWQDGAWGTVELPEGFSSRAEFTPPLARHTSSDLAVAEGRAFLAWVSYVGGDRPYAMRVSEVP